MNKFKDVEIRRSGFLKKSYSNLIYRKVSKIIIGIMPSNLVRRISFPSDLHFSSLELQTWFIMASKGG